MAGERRRLAAILAADVAGYARLVGADEEGSLARLRALFREAVQPAVSAHRGRVFKLMGDAIFAEFASAVEAVRCAAALQREVEAREPGLAPELRIRLRIGLHLGDVVAEGGDLLGDGVNVAARLEALAEPGGIVASAAVAEAVRGRVPFALEDLGERALKNLDRPVRAVRIAAAEAAPAAPAERPRPALPDCPSLVVLPFQNMGGDPEQEYFADGLVEEITTALSRVRWFFVIARNSAFTYKGRAVDVRQVGRELGVRYVLEGSVRRAGGRVRITGQLVEAEAGRHVWAERFDGDLADVFDLQDRITAAVAGVIEPSLRLSEAARAWSKPTDSLDAYGLYLRAASRLHTETREASDEALALLREAILRDPGYSLAKAYLAFLGVMRVIYGWSGPDEVATSIRLARESLDASRDDPEALRLAGHALAFLAGDVDTGLAAVQRALDLAPASFGPHMSAGWVNLYAANGPAVKEHFGRVLRLSPVDPNRGRLLSGLSNGHLLCGEWEAVVTLCREALAGFPFWPVSHRNLVIALEKLGRRVEAAAAASRLLEIRPSYRVSADPVFRMVSQRDPALAESLSGAAVAAGIPA